MIINNIYQTLLSLLFTCFIASLIIFDLPSNIIYSNILNILLWGLFIVLFLVRRDHVIYIPNLTIAYSVFTAYAFSSILWAMSYDLAFSYAMRLLIALINLVVLYMIFKYYKLENCILYGVLIGAFYNFCIQFDIISVSYPTSEFNRFTGSVGNSNKLAKTMLMSIFASLIIIANKNTKTIFRSYNYLNIILSTYIIVLTVSKKAIILAPLLIISTLSLQSIKIKNIVVFSMISFILFKILMAVADFEQLNYIYDLLERRFSGLVSFLNGYTGDTSTKEREVLINNGLEVFANNPILGIGLNNFRYLFVKYSHNNYIELLSGLGLIGALLFYSMYALIFSRLIKMSSIGVKRVLFSMVFIFLLMDIATVSYFNKLVLFILLYIYYVAEENEEIGEEYNINMNNNS